MLSKNSFIPVVAAALGFLAWWSSYLPPASSSGGGGEVKTVEVSAAGWSSYHQVQDRRDLVETLERLVSYERYYRSVYGRYTPVLSRTGYRLPQRVTEAYDVRVVVATTDRLLIHAFSEDRGKILDLVSIDQNFSIHANFEVPAPRVSYLKERALRRLRQMASQQGVDGGMDQGYFRFSFRENAEGRKIPSADGVKNPVSGVHLELSEEELYAELPSLLEKETLVLSNLSKEFGSSVGYSGGSQTGQQSDASAAHLAQQELLAQAIFFGETGRHAKSWSELSQVAHFDFEKRHFNIDGVGPAESSREESLAKESKMESSEVSLSVPRQISSRSPAHSPVKKLVIEPIEGSMKPAR